MQEDFKDLICHLAEQSWTLKTSHSSQIIPEIFLYNTLQKIIYLEFYCLMTNDPKSTPQSTTIVQVIGMNLNPEILKN